LIPLRDSIRLNRLSLVTIALIAANVIAIAAGGSILGGPTAATIVHYGAIPYEFTHLSSHCDIAAAGFATSVLCTGQAHVLGAASAQPATWETAFSAMFLHADLLHLAGNMAFLALFGRTLEDRIGRLRFLAFYLLGGLVALALQVAASPGSTTPTLGASGAIAAVLAGYVVLFPRARVLMAIPIRTVEVPAWLILVLWLAFDVLLGVFGVSTPFGGHAGASYYAHFGGFAFGLLAVRAFARGRQPDYGPPPRIA
jgi:membrane associated rhomboid family serine protease